MGGLWAGSGRRFVCGRGRGVLLAGEGEQLSRGRVRGGSMVVFMVVMVVVVGVVVVMAVVVAMVVVWRWWCGGHVHA